MSDWKKETINEIENYLKTSPIVLDFFKKCGLRVNIEELQQSIIITLKQYYKLSLDDNLRKRQIVNFEFKSSFDFNSFKTTLEFILNHSILTTDNGIEIIPS